MDTNQLALAIQSMTPRSKLYKVLKRELSLLGYWRNRPRGNPAKGYKARIEASFT